MKNQWIPRLALVGGLLLPGLALAQPGPGGDPGKMIERVADKLELTDTQRDKLREVASQTAADTAADRQRMRELRRSMNADPYDADAAAQAAQELGEITARLSLASAEFRNAMAAELTPEQLAQWEEMREAHGGKRPRKGQGRGEGLQRQ